MDENQLAQLYQQYLGRAPDPSGIATWSGQDPSTVIAGILGSQEYQSRSGGGGGEPTPIGVGGTIQPVEQNDSQGMNPEQILNKAYQDVFGRAPDPAAQGWLRDINAGLDLQGLKNILATTPEARNKALEGVSPIVGQNDPNNFVSNINQLYMSSLGRLPDKESLVNNLNLLNQNPDAFGWLSRSVTGSEEAQKYAQKTGIDQDAVYNQVTGDYGKWTPAASSAPRTGIGGFFERAGPYLPFALAAGALAAPYLTGAGAAGSGFVGLDAATAAELGLSGGSGLGTAGASGNVLSGLYGLESGLGNLGYALPGDEIVTAEMAAQRAAALPELYPGGALPPEGYSTIYTPAGDVAYAPTADLEAYAAAGGSNLLSSLGSILKTPLGQLGAMGGLSLLSGGSKQQPVPQMAGGGGTYAPKGMVDYTPILTLLAPRQISRNSLLG